MSTLPSPTRAPWDLRGRSTLLLFYRCSLDAHSDAAAGGPSREAEGSCRQAEPRRGRRDGPASPAPGPLTLGLCNMMISLLGDSSFFFHSSSVTASMYVSCQKRTSLDCQQFHSTLHLFLRTLVKLATFQKITCSNQSITFTLKSFQITKGKQHRTMKKKSLVNSII